MLRWNGDGTLDTSFAVTNIPLTRVEKVIPNEDGRIVLLGYQSLATNRTFIRINGDGSLDRFQPEIKVDEDVTAVAIYPNGALIVSVGATNSQIKRLSPEGIADPNFQIVTLNFGARCIALDEQGRILVGGSDESHYPPTGGLVRLFPDGNSDPGFYRGFFYGRVMGVVPTSTGDITIGGEWYAPSYMVAKLTDAGAAVTIFKAPSMNGTVSDVLCQRDGKVLIRGSFTRIGKFACKHFARLNQDGSVDSGFALALRESEDVAAAALSSNDKLVIGTVQRLIGGGTEQLSSINTDNQAPGLPSFAYVPTNVTATFNWTGEVGLPTRASPGADFQWLFNRQPISGQTNS